MQDCKVILQQAKNMKGTWDAAGSEGRRNLKNNHKKELNVMGTHDLNALVEKAVKAEMTKACKKAKTEKFAAELNAFEELHLSESDEERSLISFGPSESE
jgi:hypothetical protein